MVVAKGAGMNRFNKPWLPQLDFKRSRRKAIYKSNLKPSLPNILHRLLQRLIHCNLHILSL